MWTINVGHLPTPPFSSRRHEREFHPAVAIAIAIHMVSSSACLRNKLNQLQASRNIPRLFSINGDPNSFELSDNQRISPEREGSGSHANRQGESHSSKGTLTKLRRYGIAGILSYGLLNTVYYLSTFLFVWVKIKSASLCLARAVGSTHTYHDMPDGSDSIRTLDAWENTIVIPHDRGGVERIRITLLGGLLLDSISFRLCSEFLLHRFYVVPAPGKMGYFAAIERFLKLMAMVWAGSQVTKLLRAAGALALAPVVDKGLSWFTNKFKFESQGKAFIAIVGFCFGLAFVLFLVVTLLWA